VVEGVGDHGCEYMTGGTVVVFGETGRNFAAGMSGGIAYVWDPDGDFANKCNMAMVTLEPVLAHAEQEANVDRAIWHSQLRGDQSETDEVILKRLIERHFKVTGSTRARNLLDDWSNGRNKFIKVFPNDYKRALGEMNTARVAIRQKEKNAT
jgi:glutamate synthase (NADPH/NADH) large chain